MLKAQHLEELLYEATQFMVPPPEDPDEKEVWSELMGRINEALGFNAQESVK